jgi:hypothetical protein
VTIQDQRSSRRNDDAFRDVYRRRRLDAALDERATGPVAGANTYAVTCTGSHPTASQSWSSSRSRWEMVLRQTESRETHAADVQRRA